jgi:hypothetical protein
MKEIPEGYFLDATREHMKLYKNDVNGFRKPTVMFKLLGKLYKSQVCILKRHAVWIVGIIDRKISFDFENFEEFEKALLSCKKRYLIIDLRIISNFLGVGHQNLIIIDNKMKKIERFDPVGVKHMIHLSFSLLKKSPDKILKEALLQIPKFKNYKYLKPKCYQKLFNIQVKETMDLLSNRSNEPSGFCQMWALLVMHMKLLNPEKSTEEILKYIRSHSSKTLHKKIRDYTAYWITTYQAQTGNRPK